FPASSKGHRGAERSAPGDRLMLEVVTFHHAPVQTGFRSGSSSARFLIWSPPASIAFASHTLASSTCPSMQQTDARQIVENHLVPREPLDRLEQDREGFVRLAKLPQRDPTLASCGSARAIASASSRAPSQFSRLA